MNYRPDNWKLMKVYINDMTFYRVVAGWAGSYTSGRSWKLSTPVVEIRKVDGSVQVKTQSGSIYDLHPSANYLDYYTSGILDDLIASCEAAGGSFTETTVEECMEALC